MKRISTILSLAAPLVLAAVAFAQEPAKAETAAELTQKLGHDEYAVREAATKQLIAMGEKAVPELEKALKSDDLEVRLRAGRALRAIRGTKPERKERAPEPVKPGDPMGPGGKVVGTSLSMGNGEVTLKVTRLEDGKRITKEYKGKSIEELKKKHPELKGLLGNFNVVVGGNAFGNRLRLDMDKFWRDFNKDFGKDFNDEFWKNWQKDLQKEAERLKRLSDQWGKQWEAQRGINRRDFFGTLHRNVLGVTAMRASKVLDAQLGLRGRGVVINSVSKNSLAEKLGLQRYDVLLELNGMAIRGTGDIAVALRKQQKDGAKEATCKILRRAKEMALKAEHVVPKRELVPAPARKPQAKKDK